MSHWKRILKVLGRPSSELYEMKYYKLWTIWPTVIILLCWFAAEVLSAYSTDFKFNYRNLTEINILYTLGATIGLYLMFVVVNWAVTTLMDGKGKLREIFCATSYALIPGVLRLPESLRHHGGGRVPDSDRSFCAFVQRIHLHGGHDDHS